jgi:anti-sigma B factor antagonist
VNARSPFCVERTTPTVGRAVVAVRGDLDLFTAPRLRDALIGASELGARHVIVDLTAVTFIDSTALGVLIGAAKRLHTAGGALDLVCPNQDIRRLVQLTGLDSVFVVYASLSQATEAPQTP